MTQYPEYLRYLEDAKRAELADALRAKGALVELDKRVGDVTFDLLSQSGKEYSVYEFKSVGSKRLPRESLLRLQHAAKQHGYEFHMIVVNPPPRVRVQVDRLNEQLLDFVIKEHFPDELNSLSSNTRIEDLADIVISDIRVSDQGILVHGSGAMNVELEYGGGERRDGISMTDSYPFRFVTRLGPDGTILAIDDLEVDTTSFYE